MTETVLVTGGTGFVGVWCIVELLKRGYNVRTTVRSAAKEAGVRAAVARETDASDHLSFTIADLTNDKGWDAAVAGCDYVLHVASPLGNDAPRSLDALIAPARDGALRVLRAATKAGVKRVVVTSSGAAATPRNLKKVKVSDETVWTDPNDPNINAYRKSKLMAERAVWEFVADYNGSTSVTTILPAAIFGPVLTKDGLGSVALIQTLLKGAQPAIPRIGFNVVDVRDVAELHILAMTAPEAAGERFVAAGDFMWMGDVATVLRNKLGSRAAKVPTRNMPSLVVRFLALFMPQLRAIVPNLDRDLSFSAAKAERVLGWKARPAAVTVVDCAESLLG
tara:strand:- start:561 stop:1568 length:1008 start_codon:yes stop_codon:yes gene_type:complete